MKATDLTKNITTESLLTQFESRFGQTLNLEGMDQAQLEDMANMVRTKIHTITDNQHFGQELKDDNYQKHQMMLANQERIARMQVESRSKQPKKGD